jgi:3-hydroxybutyrate dehydrogenase
MRCREDYAKKQAVKEFIPIEAIAEMALLWLAEHATTITGSTLL